MNRVTNRLTSIANDYKSCDACRASFLLYPGKIHPNYITSRLGLLPTRCQVAGEPVILPSGKSRVAKSSLWFLESEENVNSYDLRDHLDWVLNQLKSVERELKYIQTLEGVKMIIKCVWESYNGESGPVLWPEQMKILGELNLESSFDFYYFGLDDED